MLDIYALPDPVVSCMFYLFPHLSFLGGCIFFLFLYFVSELLCCIFTVILNDIFPTLCPPGMFGGVTLCLFCVLLSEAFFAAELIDSDICCNPEKIDKCVYVGLFVANVLRLPPRAFYASCTTSSCVSGAGWSYVYFRGGKNTTVSDILSAPVVVIYPV